MRVFPKPRATLPYGRALEVARPALEQAAATLEAGCVITLARRARWLIRLLDAELAELAARLPRPPD
jgi:hypothetical protein